MTKAEKIRNFSYPSISLQYINTGKTVDGYVAQVMSGSAENSLIIKDIDYEGTYPVLGSAICLSHESAIKLAKFLKALYLDEVET